MTANELLALLGRAWPRLLIYPGGLAAFALVWLIARTENHPEGTRPRTESQGGVIGSRFLVLGSWLDVSAIVMPWLGLALLPLPRAAEISRSTDLIAVLALLEWPVLLTITTELRACDPGAPARGARRLGTALNSYPPLILATLALVSAAGSFDLAALARPPDEATPARAALLHWLGAIAWLLALPPALGIGTFAAGAPDQPVLRVGLRLRALGLAAIAALPWFPLVAGPDDGSPTVSITTGLLLPIPPLLVAALLWGYDQLTAGHLARRWARAYLAFDAALLLVLLWAAYAA